MNFLSMCKRLRSEAGLSGTGPASVLNQTGMNQKIVEWIQAADGDIQSLHSDWNFLVSDFDFPTVAGKQVYTPAEAGAPDLNRWIIEDCGDVKIRKQIHDEQYLAPVAWKDFKRSYMTGTARAVTGRPVFFAIKPDKSMALYPIPDEEYFIEGEYFRKAQPMTQNMDEPLYPSEYHMAVVWRALMFYGAYDAADEKYTHGQNEFRRLIGSMEADQMPQITWGEPLA